MRSHARLPLVLLGGVLLAGAAVAGAPTPAEAAVGDTVCTVPSGGNRVYTVTQTGPRTFGVTFVDTNILAATTTLEDGTEAYDPIPLDFRTGTNTLNIAPDVLVGAPTLSQSIETEFDETAPGGFRVTRLLHNPAAPWETVSVSAADPARVVWTHDLDARTRPDGSLPEPAAFPFLDADDAASVLELTLTAPAEARGEFTLIEGADVSFFGATHGVLPGSWTRDEEVRMSMAGCTVTLADPVTSPSPTPGNTVLPTPGNTTQPTPSTSATSAVPQASATARATAVAGTEAAGLAETGAGTLPLLLVAAGASLLAGVGLLRRRGRSRA